MLKLIRQLDDEDFSTRDGAEKYLRDSLTADQGFQLFEIASRVSLGPDAKDRLRKILDAMTSVEITPADFNPLPNLYLDFEERSGVDVIAIRNGEELEAARILHLPRPSKLTKDAKYDKNLGVLIGLRPSRFNQLLKNILVRRDWPSNCYVLSVEVGNESNGSTLGGGEGLPEWVAYIPAQEERSIVVKVSEETAAHKIESIGKDKSDVELCRLGSGHSVDLSSCSVADFKIELNRAIEVRDSFRLRDMASLYERRKESKIRESLEELIALHDPAVSFALVNSISKVDKEKYLLLCRTLLSRAARPSSLNDTFTIAFVLRSLERIGGEEFRSVLHDSGLFVSLVDFKRGILGYRWLLFFYWDHFGGRGDLYKVVGDATELNNDVFLASSIILCGGKKKGLEAIVRGMRHGNQEVKMHYLNIFIGWTPYGGNSGEPLNDVKAALKWWSLHENAIKWCDEKCQFQLDEQ